MGTKYLGSGTGGGGGSQNLWETIASDSGSTAANTTTDTLTITGGTGIDTSIVGDTLTVATVASEINHDALSNFVANEHIDWTSTTSNLSTSGTIAGGVTTVTSLNVTANTNQIVLDSDAGSGFTITLTGSASGSAKVITLPNATDTLVGKATTDTFTNKTFDANGTGNSISNIDVADLANGTDGELITWDANGAPTTVATGTAGHVLTSNGAGAAPTFQAAAGGGGTDFTDWSNFDYVWTPIQYGGWVAGWSSNTVDGWGFYTGVTVTDSSSSLVNVGTWEGLRSLSSTTTNSEQNVTVGINPAFDQPVISTTTVKVYSTTDVRLFIGYTHNATQAVTADTNTFYSGIGFQFSTARPDTNWQFITNTTGTQTTTDTSVAPSTSVAYTFVVGFDGNGNAFGKIYGNTGTLLYNSGTVTSNVPTSGNSAFIIASKNLNAAAVGYELVSGNIYMFGDYI